MFFLNDKWIGEAAEAFMTFIICAAVAAGFIGVIVVPPALVVALVSLVF